MAILTNVQNEKKSFDKCIFSINAERHLHLSIFVHQYDRLQKVLEAANILLFVLKIHLNQENDCSTDAATGD